VVASDAACAAQAPSGAPTTAIVGAAAAGLAILAGAVTLVRRRAR
jgi:hypothetical protein